VPRSFIGVITEGTRGERMQRQAERRIPDNIRDALRIISAAIRRKTV